MKTTAEAILKEAYFLELRGQALYQNAMKADMSSELKDLFAFFAKEETAHADLLKEQLKKVKKGNRFICLLSHQLPLWNGFQSRILLRL